MIVQTIGTRKEDISIKLIAMAAAWPRSFRAIPG